MFGEAVEGKNRDILPCAWYHGIIKNDTARWIP